MANSDVESHTITQTHTSLVRNDVLFLFLAPYARTTRYEDAFLPKGKNRPPRPCLIIMSCMYELQQKPRRKTNGNYSSTIRQKRSTCKTQNSWVVGTATTIDNLNTQPASN